jgi:hypothetical protein
LGRTLLNTAKFLKPKEAAVAAAASAAEGAISTTSSNGDGSARSEPVLPFIDNTR